MSTFTQTDYEKIKTAYIALAAGERTVTASWGGGNTRTYARADMESLRALLIEIESDIANNTGSGSYRIARSRKNL